eukprot:3846035-Prymnesium_polylepis.1
MSIPRRRPSCGAVAPGRLPLLALALSLLHKVHAKPKGAIVYLAQVRHSSYGRDSLGYLKRSLHLLFHNYNEVQRDDVLILHEGDFDAATQAQVLKPYPGRPVRFHLLTPKYWSTPAFLKDANRSTWEAFPKYSEGYRTMIRLFSVTLWELMDDLGYEWVMRMDEESMLYSPVRYNLFEWMEQNSFEYGYRQTSLESGLSATHAGVHSVLRQYLLNEKVTPQWLLDGCPPGVQRAAARAAAAGANGWQWTRTALHNYTIAKCGEFVGFYNNFFITKVSFWRSPAVRRYIDFVDRSGHIYKRRWNDIIWQTSAVEFFMPLRKVRLLDDFTYEHYTEMRFTDETTNEEYSCPSCGAVSMGTGEEAMAAGCRRSFVRRLLDAYKPACYQYPGVAFQFYDRAGAGGPFGWSIMGGKCGLSVEVPGCSSGEKPTGVRCQRWRRNAAAQAGSALPTRETAANASWLEARISGLCREHGHSFRQDQ